MARAGYCSACRNYVYLRPDGGCGNGHGPEYVSSPYEVPDAPAQPAYQPAAQPAYQPQPVYQAQATYAQPVAAPRKKRTGLVIALVLVALLLLCGCAAAGIGFGLIPNPTTVLASPEHQKVQAAADFYKAVSTADLVGLPRTIPSAAAAAANAAFWADKVLSSADRAALTSSSWSGDVLTQVYTGSGGEKLTVTFTAIDGDKVKAVVDRGSGSTGDTGYFTMVKEPGGWKVLALGSETEELIRFTPEAVKALEGN